MCSFGNFRTFVLCGVCGCFFVVYLTSVARWLKYLLLIRGVADVLLIRGLSILSLLFIELFFVVFSMVFAKSGVIVFFLATKIAAKVLFLVPSVAEHLRVLIECVSTFDK